MNTKNELKKAVEKALQESAIFLRESSNGIHVKIYGGDGPDVYLHVAENGVVTEFTEDGKMLTKRDVKCRLFAQLIYAYLPKKMRKLSEVR
jgi:hypothetical protein